MRQPFISTIDPPTEQDTPAWWFAFAGDRLLVREEGERVHLPRLRSLAEIGVQPARWQYLGRLGDTHCYAAELPDESPIPEGMALHGLRSLYERLNDDLFTIAGRAVQIVAWDRTHQFCGQCGAPTEQLLGERAKKCPACDLVNYPRLSPAVITLVRRGDEVLLARNRNFPAGFYSVIAGFVEPGESLEETVRREILEEVGIEVADVRYFGSQPWPYPNSLMIGFTARWASGEISIDAREIAGAGWFTRDTLPRIPPKPSIARNLIDWYIENEQHDEHAAP